jgi:diguanylate cyclase (GGDEF)-like protein
MGSPHPHGEGDGVTQAGTDAKRYRRLKQGRDLVRRSALLLSAELPLPQLLGQLAALIARFVDATSVLVAIGDEDAMRLEYRYVDGAGEVPADRTIPHDSAIRAVFASGESRLHRNARDWPSAMFVPIRFGGRTVGVLAALSRAADAYDREDVTLLETCALYLGARIHDERQREAGLELEQLAFTDALSGLGNRRAFDQALVREWRRCARSDSNLAVAMLDIDYFKQFNDAYGHVAGDACLRQIAQAIENSVKRPGDVATRYGGEEFSIVLPECDAAGAARFAETVCAAVRALAIPHQGSSLGFVTVSIGVAALRPFASVDPASIVELADEALYRAKNAGRNRSAGESFVSQAPEARPRSVVHHNLPSYLAPIVGREKEVAAIAALASDSRLTSIVGAGGIGKTRVAVEVAASLLESRPDGVWFVDLAPIADARLIAGTIAAAMEIQLPPNQEPVTALAASLKPLSALLVFDNCEHIVDAVARTAERIVAAAPGVRILATSRAPLGVPGESVYRLETLDGETAIALFVARARQADRGFDLTPAGRPVVADICRRLDGIALAIELAAARAHVMSLERLLAGLDESLHLLTNGSRIAVPRQQTLRALIDWSYNLLSSDEQTAFRRLGVFAGGFSLEAAIQVVDAGAPQTGERVFGLIDKSLVVVGDSGRYGLLDSTHQYAREQLEASGEADEMRRAHARYFAHYALARAEGFGVDAFEEWHGHFSPEIDNARAALDWATRAEPATAARIVGGLIDYWVYSGLHEEGLERAEAVLAALGADTDTPSALPVWAAIARLSGWQPFTQANRRRCLEAGERAYAIAVREGDEIARAHALRDMGLARRDLGIDADRALRDTREAGEIFRAHGKTLFSAITISIHASAVALTDPQRARILHAEQAEIARSTGWVLTAARIERNLAQAEFDCGQLDNAIAGTQRAIEVFRAHKLPLDLAVSLILLSSYLAVAGRHDEAIAAGREALSLARDFDWDGFAAWCCQALALSFAEQGRAHLAARLLGFVDASYEARGVSRVRADAAVYERLTAALRERLAGDELEKDVALGRVLTVDAACALSSS